MISAIFTVEPWGVLDGVMSPNGSPNWSSSATSVTATLHAKKEGDGESSSKLEPELTSEVTNGTSEVNGGAGAIVGREDSDGTSNDVAAPVLLHRQGSSLDRADSSFKVGWFVGTESMEIRVGIRDAAERHLGMQGIEWRLVGEGGEDLVVSSKLPEGTYRFQWKRRSGTALGSGVKRLGADLETLTPNRRKKSLSEAQELMDEVVEKVSQRSAMTSRRGAKRRCCSCVLDDNLSRRGSPNERPCVRAERHFYSRHLPSLRLQ